MVNADDQSESQLSDRYSAEHISDEDEPKKGTKKILFSFLCNKHQSRLSMLLARTKNHFLFTHSMSLGQ